MAGIAALLLSTTAIAGTNRPPLLVRVRSEADPPPATGATHLYGPWYRVTSPHGSDGGHLDAWRRVHLDAEPLEGLQWHLANDGSRADLWPGIVTGADIGITGAWAITTGDPGVTIAVLDVGFPAAHPDLPAASRRWPRDTVDLDDDPGPEGDSPGDAHGLAVAALALAPRNDAGVVGVCPGCTLVPVRALATRSLARDGDLVAAVGWAAEHADVIVASWSFDPGAYVPPAFYDSLRQAAREGRGGRGCVLVFSAGNGGEAFAPYVPERMREILAVGATDERDLRAPYSNFGPELALMAPGGVPDVVEAGARVARAKLVTADLEGEGGNNPTRDARDAPGVVDDPAATASFSGTSAAAPLVAGAAALVLSVAPELTAREVAWILTETAARVGPEPYVDGRNDTYGYGRLDAAAAVALAVSGAHCHEVGEVCDNGADDDCDRAVDGHDPDCGGEDVRPFEVDIGVPCTSESAQEDCGDGLCSQPEGPAGIRFCTALCDFDCPARGACVGYEGRARCHPVCEGDEECPAGLVCAVPDASLLPPGQPSRSMCVAPCESDAQCAAARCEDGACIGQGGEPEAPLTEAGGCACSSASHGWWVGALLALAGRRRRRGTYS